ncbi:MAG: hypothetical protein IJP11_03330 [Oscillospiraceae bacterium]|nr:hypothetical protein [Oscillospiraceae bacterium]
MNQDSIRLLNECHYGAQMAVSAIDAIMEDVESNAMREHLETCLHLHETVEKDAAAALNRAGIRAKTPGMMTRKMAQVKSDMRMAVHPTDSKAAALMTDGCNSGTKMLAKQLNRRSNADVQAREIARRLIGIEDRTVTGLRPYL